MAHMEASRGIVGADQSQSPTHECLPVLPAHSGLFQTISHDAHHVPACCQCSTHGGLINSPCAPGDHGVTGCRSESSHVFSVRNQRFVDVPGADNGKTARVQNRGITTAVENRRSTVFEPFFQPLRILCIGSTHDPDRPRAPALHRLTEKKSAAEQALELSRIQGDPALFHKGVRVRFQQMGRLPVQFPQPPRQPAVLSCS